MINNSTEYAVDSLGAFRQVQKTYDGETLVVKNLDLEIRRGEFLTLLGPSGSGKTTTLMMLAGFETPTSGTILLDGKQLDRMPPEKRDIGMVFQNYALFPHMTVAENIAFPLNIRKVPSVQRKARVAKALDMVQLSGLASRRPGQLSGGQQQRVALARALVFEPKLVLMDEPLGALDKQLRERLQLEIKQIHRNIGVTIVYVTHDQSEALTMSDRVAVFNDGIIQQIAAPEELYERPQNSFVAQFIGETNRLQGVVEYAGDTACSVRLQDGTVVHAVPVNIGGVGAKTSLSLRPERLVVAPAAGSLPNIFDATVEELIYFGEHTRARIALCGSSSFILKIPNAYRRQALCVGERITVGWSIEDCRALDPF